MVTAYTNSPEDTGKAPNDPGYGITATGTQTRENRTIAADWGVLPPGTKVMIEGLPYLYVVEDSGGAIRGRHIDLYVENRQEALFWGVQHLQVTVVEWGSANGK